MWWCFYPKASVGDVDVILNDELRVIDLLLLVVVVMVVMVVVSYLIVDERQRGMIGDVGAVMIAWGNINSR